MTRQDRQATPRSPVSGHTRCTIGAEGSQDMLASVGTGCCRAQGWGQGEALGGTGLSDKRP